MLNDIRLKNKIDQYPFNIIDFDRLDLNVPVIFFTGDNGSGKSTILRAIADLSNTINLGHRNEYIIDYPKGFQISWNQILKRGYYFQSEDFYTYLSWAKDEIKINKEFLDEAEARHTHKNTMGYLLETGLHKSNAKSMENIVEDYMNVSHGEGYIAFFFERLRSNTLYLLDEPESPLSFQNQLTFLKLMDDYVKEGSQFIICTHSPILLAYPNAKIYYFNGDIQEVDYNEHPIVKDYKLFIDSPKRFMHHLLKEQPK